jgi:hypothetical protein
MNWEQMPVYSFLLGMLRLKDPVRVWKEEFALLAPPSTHRLMLEITILAALK